MGGPGGLGLGRMFFVGVVVLAVAAAGVAYYIFAPQKTTAPREVVMSGEQFAVEYSGYRVDPPALPAGSEYYNFPTLQPGDVLRIRDRISALSYSPRLNATAIALNGFERCPALKDGLLFAGNQTRAYSRGDMVELTFHVVYTERQASNGTLLYSAELLDELNGLARERSPDGIPESAIHRFND